MICRRKYISIPPKRVRYLSEISETIRKYNQWSEEQADEAQKWQALSMAQELLQNESISMDHIEAQKRKVELSNQEIILQWPDKLKKYKDPYYIFKVRDKELKIATHTESLSHLQIPKVSLPKYKGWGDILKWNLKENVPGEFPFAAGCFSLQTRR